MAWRWARSACGSRRIRRYTIRAPRLLPRVGLPSLAGRIFTTADAQQSVIVSLAFAQRNFATAAGAVGRSVFIEDRFYDIVGVMPDRMRFPANTEVWAADSLLPENKNRSGFNDGVVAKLATGVSLEAANGRLAGFASQLAYTYPDTNKRMVVG